MAVLSHFGSSLSGSGELRWILLPRRRSLSPCTQAGDGTGLFWSVFVQLGFSKGVVYDSWMVSLRASSPQSSSARPFSILLHLKAMFLLEWCLCSVKMFFSVWHQSGFQLRVLLLRFSKTSSDVAALSCSRWSSLRHTWICSHPIIA